MHVPRGNTGSGIVDAHIHRRDTQGAVCEGRDSLDVHPRHGAHSAVCEGSEEDDRLGGCCDGQRSNFKASDGLRVCSCSARLTGKLGTLLYMAPEVFLRAR